MVDETSMREVLFGWFWKVVAVFGLALITCVVLGIMQLGDCADKETVDKLVIQTTKTAAAVESLTEQISRHVQSVDKYIEKTEKRDAKQEEDIVELKVKLARDPDRRGGG